VSKAKRIEPPAGTWYDEHGPVRIMAVVEGYVIFRRSGCHPALAHIRDFAGKYQPQPLAKAEATP
jgi:hypothetical protein